MKSISQQLRQNQTDSEQLLWRLLRNRHVMGVKFRRQHAIGSYIVDFYCSEKKLIVEIDGEIHSYPERVASDRQRQAWLEGKGYQVIRFSVDEVMSNPDGVLETLREALMLTPHPHP